MSAMQDPFYVVKEEVQQSVSGVVALYDRWKHLLESTNSSTNDEFKWTSNELKTGIRSIEWDLNDLDETIGIVESNRVKFGLEEGEVAKRRAFVSDTKRKIQDIKDDLTSIKTKSKMEKDSRELLMAQKQPKNGEGSGHDRIQNAIIQDNEEFIRSQQQQQELMRKNQDDKLDILGKNVNTLKDIGSTINVALDEHDDLIGEVTHEVDKADDGLKGAIKKVNKLIESSKDSTQWAFIIILIVVLVGLIVLVFYV